MFASFEPEAANSFMRSIQVKSVLNKTKRRDRWFLDDYTINPYSGCSFNCTYCYIRGSKYGENMEEKLAVKENAIAVLDKQLTLRERKKQFGIIVLASATEPYLQVEEKIGMTRQMLEVILAHRFPVHVITKSDLVVRDFDLLREINNRAILPADLEGKLNHRVIISFSFSTLDHRVARVFEPGATDPSRRLQTLKRARDEGFHSGVSLMPLLPLISDTQEQIEKFYSTFSEAGAKYIFPASITLFGAGPADGRTLTLRAIEKHFPEHLGSYNEIFARGFQTDWKYRRDFTRRVRAAREKYPLPDSLLS